MEDEFILIVCDPYVLLAICKFQLLQFIYFLVYFYAITFLRLKSLLHYLNWHETTIIACLFSHPKSLFIVNLMSSKIMNVSFDL